MFIYANGYNVSVKNDQSEVIIRFTQSTPVFSGKTDSANGSHITDVQEEVVSSIIMNGGLAASLVRDIGNMLSKDGQK